MRLIDADALLEKVHDSTKHIPLYAPFKICTADVVDLKFLLYSEPTIDAVPVVRCKDCEHFRDYIDRHGVARMYCIKNNHVPNVEPEHYCSYGERKEGADRE